VETFLALKTLNFNKNEYFCSPFLKSNINKEEKTGIYANDSTVSQERKTK